MSDTTTYNPQKTGPQRWKNAVDKFKKAIILEKYTPGKLYEELIDCVRFRIVQSIEADKTKPYLEEITTTKQTLSS